MTWAARWTANRTSEPILATTTRAACRTPISSPKGMTKYTASAMALTPTISPIRRSADLVSRSCPSGMVPATASGRRLQAGGGGDPSDVDGVAQRGVVALVLIGVQLGERRHRL